MEELLNLVKPLIELYSGKLGFLVQAISIVGSLRIAIKPIVSLVTAVVLITPSKKDDLLPAKILESKGYKTFVFIVDYLASIKLPKK
jgi:hypothetical protein